MHGSGSFDDITGCSWLASKNGGGNGALGNADADDFLGAFVKGLLLSPFSLDDSSLSAYRMGTDLTHSNNKNMMQ